MDKSQTLSEVKERKRLELQTFLETLTEKYVKKGDKTKHVYFNPPPGFQMEFPCIIYEESKPASYHADNVRYFTFFRWKVTTMTLDPEALDLAPQVYELPRCSLNSAPFRIDGIVHHVFELYW